MHPNPCVPSTPRRRTFRRISLGFCATLLVASIGCSDTETPTDRDVASPDTTAPQTPQSGNDGAQSTEAPMKLQEPDAARGREVYASLCKTCHGEEGRGDGPGAASLNPQPRDFVEGAFSFDADGDGERGTTDDLRLVVEKGAAAYGGSDLMTPWGATLDDQQIADVVAYVQTLSGGE